MKGIEFQRAEDGLWMFLTDSSGKSVGINLTGGRLMGIIKKAILEWAEENAGERSPTTE